jgi:CBS domain-containing protein
VIEENLMDKCSEIMTENPVCCLASDKVEAVAQWMRTENIGSIPVVENYQSRKLIGIVTDRDLALRVVGGGRNINSTTVGDVMTPDPVTCRPSDRIDRAMETMVQRQVRRIPTVSSDGQLVGIISQADLATRLHDPRKTADVLHEISQPNPLKVHY